MRKIFLAFFCSLVLLGCKNEEEDQRVVDERLIQEYIADNNLNATPTGSGLYIIVQDSGLAGRPDLSNVVKVYYTGTLLDGTEFDARNRPSPPLAFALANLIQGWQEGIPYIGKSGKQTLLVPSHLGYGTRRTGSIPSNSVLVFDIELDDYY